MEKQPSPIDDKLFDYLDGKLSEQEKLFFEQTLAYSESLRKQVDEQRMLTSFLKELPEQEPSDAFTNNIMQKINTPSSAHSFSIKNGFLLLMGVLTVSIVASLLIQSGVFDVTGLVNLPNEVGFLYRYIKLPAFDIQINGKMIVKGIIIVNLAIGFVILDRAILRPYFERRLRNN